MILAKPRAKPILGPDQHGRKMSLKAFEFATVEEGYQYELARGYVVVSEVANYYHQMQIVAINSLLWAYFNSRPGVIHAICGSNESKLLIPDWQSERHPDLSVYLSAPKGKKDRTLWRTWIPELVIEVVSESSCDCDLRRGRSQWTEKSLGVADTCDTKLLPGFKLPCKTVFDAGREEGD